MSSQQTPRWSKADSNSGSHPRATPPAATRFVADSALEGTGFELPVRACDESGFHPFVSARFDFSGKAPLHEYALYAAFVLTDRSVFPHRARGQPDLPRSRFEPPLHS